MDALQTVKKMHICMCISICMCNKNVQVSSIHGKKWHVHTNAHTNVHFFPVYGWNLYIFITHAHGNSNTNVHFFNVCGAPFLKKIRRRRIWRRMMKMSESCASVDTHLMVDTRISVLAKDKFDYLKMLMCQHSSQAHGKTGTGLLPQQWC